MQQMSAAELHEYLKTVEKLPILLDVREEWEYQTCHIKDSLHIPMNDVPQSLNQLDPSETIVVICHHGMRSLQVGYFLEKSGFTRIINLKGGIDAWARQVDNTLAIY